MKQSLDTVLQAVEACQDTILAAERHIWKHPETGFKECKTHAYLKAKYEELGYTVTEAGNIPGFWTDVDTGRPGPKVVVFGEMDSLIVPTHPECDPETGAVHACGHHCQCAALLGVADHPVEPKKRSCLGCPAHDSCSYRKSGGHCGIL